MAALSILSLEAHTGAGNAAVKEKYVFKVDFIHKVWYNVCMGKSNICSIFGLCCSLHM